MVETESEIITEVSDGNTPSREIKGNEIVYIDNIRYYRKIGK